MILAAICDRATNCECINANSAESRAAAQLRHHKPPTTAIQNLALEIPGLEDSVAIRAIKVALRGNPFYYAIASNKPKSMAELLQKAEKFIKKEKAYHIKKAQKFSNDEKESSNKRKDESQKTEETKKREKRGPPSGKFPMYTPLTRTPSYIMEEVHTMELLKFPPPEKPKRLDQKINKNKCAPPQHQALALQRIK
ncbi:Retrotransposon gag protein [Senna tora]|uniref:Retrotransposon gag protein n=1 Tax=Senna tora TaxID=362788 RepID=A0A834TUE9_9FABA|nr:Retrotransposon gag protein [Senna tora]